MGADEGNVALVLIALGSAQSSTCLPHVTALCMRVHRRHDTCLPPVWYSYPAAQA